MDSANIFLTDEPLNVTALSEGLTANPKVGAGATFTGYVRDDGELTALELRHHPIMTQTALEQIARIAIDRFGITEILIAHRYGRMEVGEPIVHIATTAPHRRPALDAVSFTIDILKTQAPFWKREWRGDTSNWVEPTREDHDKSTQWLEGKE